MGCSGNSRFSEFFERGWRWESVAELRDDFVRYVKDIGCAPLAQPEDYGDPPAHRFALLVATYLGGMPHLTGISCTGAMWTPARFAAIGSGADFAYGAAQVLFSRGPLGFLHPEPDELVRLAVETAIVFDAGCGGEVVVERLRS